MPAPASFNPAYPRAALTRHGRPLAFLALILALHTVVNAWWLATDNLPRMGDDAQHAVFAREMHAIATNAEWSVQGRIKALALASTGIYPPLFHYASLAGGLVFGPSRAGFAAINTPILWLLTFAAYALAAHCLRPRYALLAAATCSALPMIAGVSRLCVTDLLTALWVTLALIALLHADGFNARRSAALFGLLMGLGLLTRWMVPLYLVVPVLVALAVGWGIVRAPSLPPERQRAATRRWMATLGLTAAVALLIAAPWYAPRIPQMLGVYTDYFRPLDGPSPFHAGGATEATPPPSQVVPSSRITLDEFGPFELRTWISYALLLNNKGLFLPTSLLTLAGLLLAVCSPRRRDFGYLLAFVAGAYLVLTLFWAVRAPAPRYLIPMLPALAVFPALALQSIPWDRWRKAAVVLFGVWLLFQFAHFSIASISGLVRADIPLFRAHPLVRDTDDRGLVVWSAHVNASGARIGPPYTGLNWIDRAYEAMRTHEVQTLPGNRHQANVMLAGALKPSLESVQHEHWPQADPLESDSPRVRAMVNPYTPVAQWETDGVRLDVRFTEPLWLDAIGVEGGAVEIALEYRDSAHDWQPLVSINNLDGFGFQSFARVRVQSLRTVEPIEGTATITAYRFIPQPRPSILIEQAVRPRDWPEDRIEVADYLVVVSPKGRDYFAHAPQGFEAIEQFEANLHGYWDERRISVHARNHIRPLALDTTPGMRVEVIAGGETHEGRWDMPWWRLGRFNAPGIEGRPEAWVVNGPATIEVTLPEPIALGRIEAEVTTRGTVASWEMHANGQWSPLDPSAPPDAPIDALRLTLTPAEPGGVVGLRQVHLEPRRDPAR